MKRSFERLLKIDALLQLRKPHAVSKEELLQRCKSSERTLKGDISYMRDVMDAPIKYYRREKGYHYYEDYDIAKHLAVPQKEIQQMLLGMNILERIEDNEVLVNIFSTYSKLEIQKQNPYAKYIYFEKVPFYEGSHLISFFLEAMEQKKTVQLEYHSFTASKSVKRVLHPYFLKEHNNRWFVIGNLPEFESLVTYALDRIKNNDFLKILEDTFQHIPIDPDIFFKHTYGITVFNDAPIETVELVFSGLQKKYFLSKPFYPYELIEESADQARVIMLVKPNYEFLRKLVSMGAGVKIIKPQTLIVKLVTFVETVLQQYK